MRGRIVGGRRGDACIEKEMGQGENWFMAWCDAIENAGPGTRDRERMRGDMSPVAGDGAPAGGDMVTGAATPSPLTE